MIILLLIVLLLLLAGASCVSFYYDKRRTNVIGPPTYPFVGNGHLLAVDSSRFVEVLGELENKYSTNTLIYLFSKRYILSSDPEFIEDVVSSTKILEKAGTYKFIRTWLGEGLLTSSGARWKAHRKFLTPAFHFNILQNFLPIFCKNGRILTQKLRAHVDGPAFDVLPFIALAALDNVAESIMGVNINAQNDTNSLFVKAVNDISSIICMRMRNPFVGPDIVFNLLPYKRTQDKALKILHEHTVGVINARKKELKNLNIKQLDMESSSGIKNKHAFLDLLLLAEVDGEKISDACIREEVDTFMFEGHDTTMSGISFCLYCISLYPDVQEKLWLEQKSIFGDDLDRDPTYSELPMMKYLELVIKESLRLYPSVPFIGREVLEESVIKGFRVPKDTTIIIDFFHMQRDPKVYEDPLEFRPERFETANRNPFTWLAFSAGPRNCIGQKFAMMELKVTISEIVRNFKLLPSGIEPVLGADLILRSHNGVKVKLTARSQE